jgi:hypothetical protein
VDARRRRSLVHRSGAPTTHSAEKIGAAAGIVHE